jgi:hypothetical protein
MTRRVAVLLGSLLVLAPTVVGAAEIGLRYGKADLRGARLFPGSGDLGGTDLIGIQLVLDLLPLVDVEIAGEAYEEDFRFEQGRFEDILAHGTGTFKDTAILATAKLGLPVTLLVPGKLYVGLGLSAHFVDVDVTATPVDTLGKARSPGSLEDAMRDVVGERTEVEWHGVLGAKFSIPVLPLSAFAEVRYQDVLDDRTPDLGSAYVGVNLRLK